ncbi:MAG: response regulator [Vicinamibacteraceae bacterium]
MMPKLLLADDSITVQRVIALTFQGEGIEVIAVGDGDLAVAAIDRERPQSVLADLSRPGRDGYAVAEYVKRSPELSKDIRVVLLTGAAEPVEEARSRELGIDGVLSKPFEPHVATALVRRLLSEPPIAPGFRTVVLDGAGAPAETAAPAAGGPPPLPVAAATPVDNTIAVDDYFRRLDEALATAGLSTAPDSVGDLAAIAVPRDRSTDAETMMIPRLAAAVPVDASAEDDADAPKLVDAFSAMLDAEEGRAAGFVAGPIEMEGAPAPVHQPAVEWTPGQAAAPVEAAAETVAFQAVAAEAAEEASSEVASAEAADAAAPGAETSAGPISVNLAIVDAAAAAPVDDDLAVDVAEVADAAATVMITRPLLVVSPPVAAAEPASAASDAEPVAMTAPSASPAALRADAPDHSVLDGLDLDQFADAVAQKILHRLTDARIDAIVSERVLEIAERLVREEIERIKSDAQ